MAVRDFSKAEKAVKAAGLSKDSYSLMYLDLASQTSVRQFVEQFRYRATGLLETSATKAVMH